MSTLISSPFYKWGHWGTKRLNSEKNWDSNLDSVALISELYDPVLWFLWELNANPEATVLGNSRWNVCAMSLLDMGENKNRVEKS
jgi:hypothetical protein